MASSNVLWSLLHFILTLPTNKKHTLKVLHHVVFFSVWKKKNCLIIPKCQYNTGRQNMSGPYFHLHSCFLHGELLGSAYLLSLQIHKLAAGSLNPLFLVFKVLFFSRSYADVCSPHWVPDVVRIHERLKIINLDVNRDKNSPIQDMLEFIPIVLPWGQNTNIKSPALLLPSKGAREQERQRDPSPQAYESSHSRQSHSLGLVPPGYRQNEFQ